MRPSVTLVLLAMWLGCSVPDVELDDRACPCAEEAGYFCDTARNVCERREGAPEPLLEESFEDAPGALEGRATAADSSWTIIEGDGMVEAGAAINTNAPFTAYVDLGVTSVRIEAELTLPPRGTTEHWMAGTVAGGTKTLDPDIVDGAVVRVDHNQNTFTIRIEDFVGRSLRSGRVRRLFDVLDVSGGRIRIVQITAPTGVVAYIDGHFEDSVVVLPLPAPLAGTNVGITVNDGAGAVGVRWEHLRVLANVEDTTPPTTATDLRITDGLLEWNGASDNLALWGYQMSRRTLTGSGWEGPTLAADATSYMPGAAERTFEGYWPGEETEAHVLAFDIAGNVSSSNPLRYTVP